MNESGGTYLYLAIATNVKSAPSLAKSFTTNSYTSNNGTAFNVYQTLRSSFSWLKNYDNSSWSHLLMDTVRAFTSASTPNTNIISSDTTSDTFDRNSITSFNPNGLSIGTYGGSNDSTNNIISWSWKSAESASLNSTGSINTVVNANQAAGFSFLRWKGTGAQGTLGHGLSSAPELIISKNLSNTNNWSVYSSALGLSHTSYPNWLYLNLTSGEQNSGSSVNHPYYQAPSTSLIYQNTGTSESTNVNGDFYISYCFHSISGYSKVGSYTGNGTSYIVYTTDDGTSGGANGFQPDFVLVKRYDSGSAGNWVIVDSVRGVNYQLYPNLTNTNNYDLNGVQSFNSNGFTVGSAPDYNAGSGTYIYLAIKFN
jgi:hypothetical protein